MKKILNTIFAIFAVAVFATACVANREPIDIRGNLEQIRVETIPQKLSGSWQSIVGSWGGAFDLRVKERNGNRFNGEMLFANSACSTYMPYEGSFDDNTLKITAYLGGRCGDVVIEITNTRGKNWSGTYNAPSNRDRGLLSLIQ